MPERFVQKKILLTDKPEAGKLKVSNLMTLLNGHPYQKQVSETFKTAEIKDEHIVIDNIETVFNKIRMEIPLKLTTSFRFKLTTHSAPN